MKMWFFFQRGLKWFSLGNSGFPIENNYMCKVVKHRFGRVVCFSLVDTICFVSSFSGTVLLHLRFLQMTSDTLLTAVLLRAVCFHVPGHLEDEADLHAPKTRPLQLSSHYPHVDTRSPREEIRSPREETRSLREEIRALREETRSLREEIQTRHEDT